MDTVIGLFCDETQAENSIRALKDAGFGEHGISILTDEGDICQLFDCYDRSEHFLAKCISMTAILGMVVFAPIGFLISFMVCTSLNCSSLVWLIASVILTVIAGIFGSAFGCFFGRDAADRETEQYAQWVCEGGQVVAVQVESHARAEQAMLVLEHVNAQEIQTLTDIAESVFDSLTVAGRHGPNSTVRA